MEQVPEYDKYGRMKRNPEFHKNTGKGWTMDDLNYLIEYYDKIGPEEMSFALERTISSVMQKVQTLRNEKIMTKPCSRSCTERIKKDSRQRV